MTGPGVDRIAVIGASLAGLSAAETLRAEGYGGTITLVGAEDQLPYDRPPLSKQVLTGEREPDSTALRTNERYDELDLDLRLGTHASALDPAAHEVTLDGATDAAGGTVGFQFIILYKVDSCCEIFEQLLKLKRYFKLI